jgi:hypothetical protein
MDFEYVSAELERLEQVDPFTGFAEAWVLLLQLALTETRAEDFERVTDLLRRLPERDVRELLHSSHLNALLNMKPPLETVIVSAHERMATIEVREASKNVALKRDRAPRKAMNSAATILRVIRNKREHGFKSRSRPRDMEVLGAATPFLLAIIGRCVTVLRGSRSDASAAAN